MPNLTPKQLEDFAERIKKACPCPRIAPWEGCCGTNGDYGKGDQDQARADECACISTLGVPCEWPGHAVEKDLEDLAAGAA